MSNQIHTKKHKILQNTPDVPDEDLEGGYVEDILGVVELVHDLAEAGADRSRAHLGSDTVLQ